jgi:hypothetical protein
MILDIADLKWHNSIVFGCAGTVQENCVNFRCYTSLGHEELGTSSLLPKANLRQLNKNWTQMREQLHASDAPERPG